MNRLSCRQVLADAGAATMLGAPSVRPQTNQQTLRFIAEGDLKVLDPIWTTAYITRNLGYLVYDTPERLETAKRSVQQFLRGLVDYAVISQELPEDIRRS
jgi:hypothetical protein